MQKCLDASCSGVVVLIHGRLRCNICGIVQDKNTIQNFKETLSFLDKETRQEDCLEAGRHDF